jgi:CRISPR/Cas system CMR subunit Cmr4 (Cas7 group RAMP superfamily)
VPDLVPQSEARILWQGDKAVIVLKQPVVPASAVKGALAHRFAYHYRCLTGQFLNSEASAVEMDNLQLEGVKELFGFASDSDLSGAAGALVIDDIYLDQPVVARQTHNKIDQFTGGVISGALFEEEFFWQTPLSLSLNILRPERISAQSREALKRTLEDLCEGFLPLGAGGSRGLGAFIAQQGVKWSDQGNWIEGRDSKESIG